MLPAASMTSRSGVVAGLELDAIGRAARNDDVVERPERQRAEHRVQRSPAAVDEEDLVGRRRCGNSSSCGSVGPAAGEQDHVAVAQQRHAAGDRVAAALACCPSSDDDAAVHRH